MIGIKVFQRVSGLKYAQMLNKTLIKKKKKKKEDYIIQTKEKGFERVKGTWDK